LSNGNFCLIFSYGLDAAGIARAAREMLGK
jgi:hypothetical protein